LRDVGLLALALCLSACASHESRANGKQVIVIGVDGMDPGFVERHWADLPNLAKLRDEGSFSRLQTTNPPQSPTAWSTFITGLDPADHGIFDFVHRDPATLQPFLSYTQTPQPGWTLPIGPYALPLSPSHLVSLRRGKAFWQTLAEQGIPSTIVRMPTNYPPVESGIALAGMGTPDLRGTQGTFSYYTDDPGDTPRAVNGGEILRATVNDCRAILHLEGPPDPLRRDHRETSAQLTIDVDPDRPLARITAGDTRAIVREGHWSGWLPVDFALIPHLISVRGVVRVYAKQLHPRFELYISPVNVDPELPDLPISTPRAFSRDIASGTGRYYTLGIPEDTAALRQGVFDLQDFLAQSRLVMQDERKLLNYSLDHFREGFLFFYFSSVDQNSHMLWGQHDAELLKVYREVDDAIGEVRSRNPRAQLIVMSDHGFSTFDRGVNLNRWFLEQGLQAKAYALGLNAVYLNLAGRESHGTVQPGAESRALIDRLRAALLALRDPANGHAAIEVVTEVHASEANLRIAPDLIVGYAPGYRASWETGTGGMGSAVFEDNTDAWIADHCINPADVPGVLFTSNKTPDKTEPGKPSGTSIKDLSARIVRMFAQ
jgi:predicted AlkP superfamily phosphohydrolase/phosphomutase